MQAKIADLGLSKAFANDTDTHISTRPAGTFGYLDPEYVKTNKSALPIKLLPVTN